MPFIAKSAMPCDPDPAAEHQVFDEAARGGHTLFTAPPGYLVSEGLSAAYGGRVTGLCGSGSAPRTVTRGFSCSPSSQRHAAGSPTSGNGR